jgi:hypothetical protein
MRRVSLALCLLLSLATLSWVTAPAGAGVAVKSGRYSGATTQRAVAPAHRGIQFKLTKKRVVRLLVEPTVAEGLCLSAPIFTIDGPSQKRLSGRGRFSITKTFVGSRFHRISGRFVSPTEIEGFVVIIHFDAQDFCEAGRVKVRFSVKRV